MSTHNQHAKASWLSLHRQSTMEHTSQHCHLKDSSPSWTSYATKRKRIKQASPIGHIQTVYSPATGLRLHSLEQSHPATVRRDTLERFQRKAAKIILGYRLSDHLNHTYLLSAVEWNTLSSRRSDSSSSLVQHHPISSPRFLHDTPHLNHCATQGSSPSHLPTPKHISSHPYSRHATFSIPYLTPSKVPRHAEFMSLASPHFLSTQCCCSAQIPSALPFPLAHRN